MIWLAFVRSIIGKLLCYEWNKTLWNMQLALTNELLGYISNSTSHHHWFDFVLHCLYVQLHTLLHIFCLGYNCCLQEMKRNERPDCFILFFFSQYYSSCKTGNMDSALSVWFLLFWLAGDSCNLIGSFLADQLPLQVRDQYKQMSISSGSMNSFDPRALPMVCFWRILTKRYM